MIFKARTTKFDYKMYNVDTQEIEEYTCIFPGTVSGRNYKKYAKANSIDVSKILEYNLTRGYSLIDTIIDPDNFTAFHEENE